MSRHSKWSQIKRQKGVTDVKRGALFTKLAKNIALAVKELGGDPAANFKLRMVMDQARAANMPKDNIERAIKRGTGELSGENIEEIVYEGFGPQGVALIVHALTDNKNRTASNIKHILTKYGGRMGGVSSTAWMFEKKGVIHCKKEGKREEIELKIIDAGAEDFEEEDDSWTVLAKPEQLQKVKERLEKEKIIVNHADLEFIAKEKIKIESLELKNKLEKMFEELEDNEDVNNYYTNTDL